MYRGRISGGPLRPWKKKDSELEERGGRRDLFIILRRKGRRGGEGEEKRSQEREGE